jgi:hypothetical protein
MLLVKPPLAFRIGCAYVHPNIFEFDQNLSQTGEALERLMMLFNSC